MDAPTVAALLTVAGAAVAVALIVQLLLNTLQLAPATQDRFGPLIAVIVGVLIVEAATFTVGVGTTGTDIFQGAINGVFAGLASMGIHNIWTKTVIGPPG